MSLADVLGRHVRLTIRRFGSPGAFLALGDEEVVLLVGGEIPEGAKVGDEVDVFVYLDSAARPIATTRVAKLEIGQVAFLRVTALTQFGAFVDWGMPKELLVPFGEQTADLRVGGRYAIGLVQDDTGRFAGTMKVSELLDREKVKWTLDEWVAGEAWREDPKIGLFVLLEREHVGLVPRTEPHRLSRGEAARFRVTKVLRDGKVELSLRGHAHDELEDDAKHILAILGRPHPPEVGDTSSPERIREVFGLSKKALKRAVGRLLKDGAVIIDDRGFLKSTTAR